MKHIGFHLHFLGDLGQDDPLKLYFQNLERKLFSFEKNAAKTTELYRSEYLVDLEKAKSKFDAEMAEAGKVYAEVMEKYGSHEDAHEIADEAAGFMYIQHDHQQHEQDLLATYQAMSDTYNKSALTLLYSLLETETSRICTILQNHFHKLIDHEALSGQDYILKYLKYLRLVIEMDVADLDQFVISDLKTMKLLRNKIIHHDSEFPGETDELRAIVDKSDGMVVQANGPGSFQFRIKKIEYVLNAAIFVRQFFEKLFWAVSEKTGYELFRSRVQFMFSAFDPAISASIESFGSIAKGYRLIVALQSDEVEQMNCSVKFSVTRAKRNSVSLINDLKDFPRMTEFNDFLQSNPNYVFDQLLQGANLTGGSHKVSIIVYP